MISSPKAVALVAAMLASSAALAAGEVFALMDRAPLPARVEAGVRSTLTTRNAADLFNANTIPDRRSQFTGVVGVAQQTNAQLATGLVTFCSGSVVGSNTVLTAAHCLDDDGSGIASVLVFLPDYNQPGRTMIGASTFYQHPDYTPGGSRLLGYDVGIIKLTSDVPIGTQVYGIDNGSVASNLGVEQMVGLGTIGTGADGNDLGLDFQKRTGFNEYDLLWSDVLAAAGLGVAPGSTVDAFGAPIDGILVSDFDSGLTQNDVFGRYVGTPGLGYVSADGQLFDVASAPGDSGGPHFRNGLITGITSFSISGSDIFESGNCAMPGSVDPSISAASGCTNSSFGEISGDTRVAAYFDFISSHVPEPGTWALMIVGFGLVGSALRRNHRVTLRDV